MQSMSLVVWLRKNCLYARLITPLSSAKQGLRFDMGLLEQIAFPRKAKPVAWTAQAAAVRLDSCSAELYFFEVPFRRSIVSRGHQSFMTTESVSTKMDK
jgi:hypothetical protein